MVSVNPREVSREALTNGAVLLVVQQYVQILNLLATNKEMAKMGEEIGGLIQYRLTTEATKEFLWIPQFREKLLQRVLRPREQLTFRFDAFQVKPKTLIEDDEDDWDLSDESAAVHGELVMKYAKNFEIEIQTKSDPCCLQYLSEWDKLVAFDGERAECLCPEIDWEKPTNMKMAAMKVSSQQAFSEEYDDEDHAVVDAILKSGTVDFLRLELKESLNQRTQPWKHFEKVRWLVLSTPGDAVFEKFFATTISGLLVLAVSGNNFFGGPSGKCDVVRHLPELCPNLVRLAIPLLREKTLAPLEQLSRLRTLVIDSACLETLPRLGNLTELVVVISDPEDKHKLFNTEHNITRTISAIQILSAKKQTFLPNINQFSFYGTEFRSDEEAKRQCEKLAATFKTLKTVKSVADCTVTSYPGFHPNRKINFEVSTVAGVAFMTAVGKYSSYIDVLNL